MRRIRMAGGLALLLALAVPGAAGAKQLIREWDKVYGGPGSDGFGDFVINPDGTMFATGRSTSYGDSAEDTFGMLLDANGNELWRKVYRYQDAMGSGEIAGQVDRTTDGGYVIAGYLSPGPLGSNDGYLIKLDANGNKLWERTYGTAAADDGRIVAATPDGGCITAGLSFGGPGVANDVMVTKFDAAGNIEAGWPRYYTAVGFPGGVDSYEGPGDIAVLPNGAGYVLTGVTYSRADTSMSYGPRLFVLRLDAAGNVLWQRADVLGQGTAIEPTADGGLILAGRLTDAALGAQGGGDGMLVKLDANGAVQWLQRYGGPGNDILLGLTQTSSGGYAAVGWYIATSQIGTQEEVQWTIVTDGGGNLLAEDINVRETPTFDNVFEVFESSDGGLIVCGNIDGVPLPPGGVGLGGRDAAIYKLRLVPDPATISGVVTHDTNASCAAEPGEFGMNNALVRLTETSTGAQVLARTGAGGLYTARVAPGTYDVALVSNERAKETCTPPSVQRISVAENDTQSGLDFFAQAAGGPCDPQITVTTGLPPAANVCGPLYAGCNGAIQTGPCVGYPWMYCVTVTNNGSTPWPAAGLFLTITLPGRSICGVESMVSTGSGSFSYFGAIGTVQYQFIGASDFLPGDSVTICLTADVLLAGTWPVIVNLNTGVCGPAFLSVPEQDDCSCDPNDMTVWPKGCGAGGDIEPQTLTYRVRFENTGAGAAHDIVVRNALDPDLDWSSFELRRSSHPVTAVQIESDGTLIVRFDGIELPAPDASAPEANKGEFVYTIAPRAGLADGTMITNSAAIYFDRNPPVITNTTTNTIRTTGSVVPEADFAVIDRGGSYDFVYTGGAPNASFYWYFGPDVTPESSTSANPTGVVLGSDGLATLIVSNGSCSSSVSKDVATLCGQFTAGDFLPPMGKRKKLGRNLPVKFDLLHAGQPVAGQQALDALLLDLGLEPTCPEILVYDVTTGTSVTLPDAPEDASASDDSDVIDNPGLCFIYQNDDGDGGDSDSDSGDTKTAHWQFNLRLDPAIFLPDRTYRVKVRIGSCILEPGNATFQTRQ